MSGNVSGNINTAAALSGVVAIGKSYGVSQEMLEMAIAAYLEKNPIQAGSKSRMGYVTILAANWVKIDENWHSQVVTVDVVSGEGVTENSQVDLTPSDDQLIIWRQKDLAFTTKNSGGTVTVIAIGQRPENDYTIQVTITEVENDA